MGNIILGSAIVNVVSLLFYLGFSDYIPSKPRKVISNFLGVFTLINVLVLFCFLTYIVSI